MDYSHKIGSAFIFGVLSFRDIELSAFNCIAVAMDTFVAAASRKIPSIDSSRTMIYQVVKAFLLSRMKKTMLVSIIVK